MPSLRCRKKTCGAEVDRSTCAFHHKNPNFCRSNIGLLDATLNEKRDAAIGLQHAQKHLGFTVQELSTGFSFHGSNHTLESEWQFETPIYINYHDINSSGIFVGDSQVQLRLSLQHVGTHVSSSQPRSWCPDDFLGNCWVTVAPNGNSLPGFFTFLRLRASFLWIASLTRTEASMKSIQLDVHEPPNCTVAFNG